MTVDVLPRIAIDKELSVGLRDVTRNLRSMMKCSPVYAGDDSLCGHYPGELCLRENALWVLAQIWLSARRVLSPAVGSSARRNKLPLSLSLACGIVNAAVT